MPPTLVHIAKYTGTSVSTVSRVLAGGPAAQRISAETRDRVIAAAKELGYRPNLLARGLRTRRSNTVAVLVSDFANPWFARVAAFVEEALRRAGYSMLLCNSGEDPHREADYLQMLPQKGIDGLILFPLARAREQVYDHVPADLPLVTLDGPVPGIAASVSTDEAQLVGVLCDTLRRALVRTAAVVTGPLDVPANRLRVELISRCVAVTGTIETGGRADGGRELAARLLDAGEPLADAVVCTNNRLGQGVVEVMIEHDRRPIVGCFDEIPMMHALPLPIACAVQDVPALAEAAVSLLLPQLRHEPAPAGPVSLPGRAATNKAFQMRQIGVSEAD